MTESVTTQNKRLSRKAYYVKCNELNKSFHWLSILKEFFKHPILFLDPFDFTATDNYREHRILRETYLLSRTSREEEADVRKNLRFFADRYLVLMARYRSAMTYACWSPKPSDILPSQVYDIRDCPIPNGGPLIENLVLEIASIRDSLETKGVNVRRFVKMNLLADAALDKAYCDSLKNHEILENALGSKYVVSVPLLLMALSLIVMIIVSSPVFE